MKLRGRIAIGLLTVELLAMPLWGQFISMNSLDPFRPPAFGTGAEHPRVTEQNADRTEILLTIDYRYDGADGPVALALPVIRQKNNPRASSWFGTDPVTIGRGRGTVSIKVRYFNDEPGVPPVITTDQVQVLILSDISGARLAAVPFLKTIHWGRPDANPAKQRGSNAAVASNSKGTSEAAAKDQEQDRTDKTLVHLMDNPSTTPDSDTVEKSLAVRKDEEVLEVSFPVQETSGDRPRDDETQLAANTELPAQTVSETQTDNKQDPALPIVLADGMRTRIRMVDVVQRRVDRTEMVLGIELDFADADRVAEPHIGVEILRTGAQVSTYFASQPKRIAKRSNSVMIPVRFQPPPTLSSRSGFETDQVVIYLQEGPASARYYIGVQEFHLSWNAPKTPGL